MLPGGPHEVHVAYKQVLSGHSFQRMTEPPSAELRRPLADVDPPPPSHQLVGGRRVVAVGRVGSSGR